MGKAILVTSENGPEYCVIDCEEKGRGFKFVNGELENSILSRSQENVKQTVLIQ